MTGYLGCPMIGLYAVCGYYAETGIDAKHAIHSALSVEIQPTNATTLSLEMTTH